MKNKYFKISIFLMYTYKISFPDAFKGSLKRDFRRQFFHESVSPWFLSFDYFMKIQGDVHNFVFIAGVKLFTGVVVTGDNKSPVTMIIGVNTNTGDYLSPVSVTPVIIYRWCYRHRSRNTLQQNQLAYTSK